MKILVTGAEGFIGSHLVETLLVQNHSVRALVQYNSFNDWGWLEHISHSENLEVILGDIRDPQLCRLLTKDIQVVFHLAALIAIPYSYRAPESYVNTNIQGTLHICQAALEASVEKVICTSTSEVYGSAHYVPIDEKHPLQAQSPYSASKIGADAIALSFFHSYQLPVSIIRPFNTYGPRQSARAIIPTVITQIAQGIRDIKLGNLYPTRDFNYISDTVSAFIAFLTSRGCEGEIINVGSGYEITIRDLVTVIADLMSAQVTLEQDDIRVRTASSEVDRLLACNKKAQKLLNWTPHYSSLEGLRKGLTHTIEWFLNPAHQKKYKAYAYNI